MNDTPKVMPALTPSEWAEGEFESFYGTKRTFAQRDFKGRWFFHSGPREQDPDEWGSLEEGIIILNQSDDNGRACHKMAALALHGQPFGFTRADVNLLRDVVGSDLTLEESLGSLADRIEALLPLAP